MNNALNIEIYEIFGTIRIPSEENPNVYINAGLGDYVVIIEGQPYVKDWDGDRSFVKPAFDANFVRVNTLIFDRLV